MGIWLSQPPPHTAFVLTSDETLGDLPQHLLVSLLNWDSSTFRSRLGSLGLVRWLSRERHRLPVLPA